MICKSIQNNIFLYLLSFSNTINYIFYFPLIFFYIFDIEKVSKLDSIRIYVFFVIYDLFRNLFSCYIQKSVLLLGLNKKISIDLFILCISSIGLFFLLYKSENKTFIFDILVMLRIIFSLANTSNIFISKIIENIFERKEIINKLKIFDFYERLNNFLVILIIFFFINSFNQFYLYFLISSIFNISFMILYIIIFKCYDENISELYEEKEINTIKNTNKAKRHDKNIIKIKDINRNQNKKNSYAIGDDNFSFKSKTKATSDNRYRKTSSEIIVNGNFNKNKLNNMDNKVLNDIDIDNNNIVLNTNDNQIIINKELTNDLIKNNNENNNQFQNKHLDINNNQNTNRSLKENFKHENSFTEIKNKNIIFKQKWKFILFIYTPSKFLKYLFLFMLFLKTYSLKNEYKIRIHLIFYCCYFLMNILIYPINKSAFSKIIKSKCGKRCIFLSSIVFLIPACLGYIYLIKDSEKNKEKYVLLKYILFFGLNFILKESLYFLIRINYVSSINLGLDKKMFKDIKDKSNILTCVLFLGYNISILFVKNRNLIVFKIIAYILYYFLPVFLILLFLIYTNNINLK